MYQIMSVSKFCSSTTLNGIVEWFIYNSRKIISNSLHSNINEIRNRNLINIVDAINTLTEYIDISASYTQTTCP
jgi:hypothetical protein